MDNQFCIKLYWLITIVPLFFGIDLIAQNCLGFQNQDILNVAKQVDPSNLSFVSTEEGNLKAAVGFKFVQLRDTETFILVPETFQGRVVDLKAFLPGNSKGKYVLDTHKYTARLTCQAGSGSDASCTHIRIAKNVVGCDNCQHPKWTSASVLSEKAVIIPVYKLH